MTRKEYKNWLARTSSKICNDSNFTVLTRGRYSVVIKVTSGAVGISRCCPKDERKGLYSQDYGIVLAYYRCIGKEMPAPRENIWLSQMYKFGMTYFYYDDKKYNLVGWDRVQKKFVVGNEKDGYKGMVDTYVEHEVNN
jgi:hypothetical protein